MRLLLSSDKALIIGRLWCDLGFLHPLRRHRLLAGEYGALLIVVRVGVRPPLDRELISIVEEGRSSVPVPGQFSGATHFLQAVGERAGFLP